MSIARSATRYFAAALFTAAGIMHFAKPAFYRRIVPPGLPYPGPIVFISGFFEILGGVGLLVPRLRPIAGCGLIALLISVFPANLYMAVRAEQFRDIGPPWLMWARLPLQIPLLCIAYVAGYSGRSSSDSPRSLS